MNRRSFLQNLGILSIPLIVPASTRFIFDLGKNAKTYGWNADVWGYRATVAEMDALDREIQKSRCGIVSCSIYPYPIGGFNSIEELIPVDFDGDLSAIDLY